MQRLLSFGRTLVFAGFTAFAGSVGLASVASAAAPLTVGYSDWPGWIAWQVAIDKGWLAQAGLDVKFEWFDYSASLSAFAAGKLDADLVANVDALVNGSGGAKSIMIMLTDYSSGNDMIVAKPPFRSIKSLKGQKIGIEVGVVEQLLLDHALAANGCRNRSRTSSKKRRRCDGRQTRVRAVLRFVRSRRCRQRRRALRRDRAPRG